VKRRDFIALLGFVANWPFTARAQQRTTIPRIGVLSPSRSEDSIPNRVILNGFMAGLRELGYVEGQNILTTTGAGLVSGTFTGTTVTGSFGANVKPVLSYDAHDVFLSLDLIASLPTLPTSASGNQTNPANAINAFIAAGGTLPPGFLNLANLPPSQLAAALTQLSGEANAGAGQAASFQITNQFLLAMLNPFGSDRSGTFGAAGFGPAGTGAVNQYAPTRSVSPEVAQAYAALRRGARLHSHFPRAGMSGRRLSEAPATSMATRTGAAAITRRRTPPASPQASTTS
jgi:hypothetical protein